MFFFKNKKVKQEGKSAEKGPVTQTLKVTKRLNEETDPNFVVVRQITYMESDEVII